MKFASITLLISGDFVWIAQRPENKTIMPGLLECAGGAQEGKEVPSYTAHREVKEEAGLDVDRNRLEYRGHILVDGWWYDLFFLELKTGEQPQNVEPEKRGPWFICSPEVLPLGACSPALGALLSIFLQEKRMRHGT